MSRFTKQEIESILAAQRAGVRMAPFPCRLHTREALRCNIYLRPRDSKDQFSLGSQSRLWLWFLGGPGTVPNANGPYE